MGEARRRRAAAQDQRTAMEAARDQILEGADEERCKDAIRLLNTVEGMTQADHLLVCAEVLASALALRTLPERVALLGGMHIIMLDVLEQQEKLGSPSTH